MCRCEHESAYCLLRSNGLSTMTWAAVINVHEREVLYQARRSPTGVILSGVKVAGLVRSL